MLTDKNLAALVAQKREDIERIMALSDNTQSIMLMNMVASGLMNLEQAQQFMEADNV